MPTIVNATATSGATATAAVTVPSPCADGDCLLVCITSFLGNASITPPSGWVTLRADGDGSTITQALYQRTASGDAGAVYNWAVPSGGYEAVCLNYAGCDRANPVARTSGQGNTTASVITAPGLAPGTPGCALVAFYGTNTSQASITPPAGETTRAFDNGTGGLLSADEQLSSGGATGSRVATVGPAASISVGQLVALRPAASSSPSSPSSPRAALPGPASSSSASPSSSLPALAASSPGPSSPSPAGAVSSSAASAGSPPGAASSGSPFLMASPSSSPGPAAACYWVGNAQNTAQVDSLTVGGTPAAGDTVTATMGPAKSVTYTVVSGDTTATVASGLQAALAAAAAVPVPEIAEATYTVAAAVVTATAVTAGTPFSLSASSTGNTTLTRASVTPNSSQSDAANRFNWLRLGVYALPQSGDDVIFADGTVPCLWNLTALAGVLLNSFTRWQSYLGSIGLPENNPSGYREYRPTYLQFGSNVINLPVLLGVGTTGTGPTRERYDFQGNRVTLTALAAGAAQDPYSVRLLTQHPSSVVNVLNTSVAVAMLPGETSQLASAVCDGGGTLDLGPFVTITGTFTCTAGAATLFCAPQALVAQQGAQVTVEAAGLTFAQVTAKGGSSVAWVSDSSITSLLLQTSSRFDKSRDVRKISVNTSEMDGDTCQVQDPNSAIQWLNPTLVHGLVGTGPITFQGDRTVKVL